ncbi:kinase-like domain-containing protein [Globomyces pollinis-pini]|nr:kinase-like domain-containing protein [Globomyces pollinis-pini]
MLLDNEEKVLTYVNTEKSCFGNETFVDAVLLSGGMVNYVWKITSQSGQSIVCKVYPPFIRTLPHLAFDVRRAEVEWKTMNAAYQLSKTNNACWTTPKPVYFDSENNLVFMEFVEGVSLFDWLSCSNSDNADPQTLDWITSATKSFVTDTSIIQLDKELLTNTPMVNFLKSRKPLIPNVFERISTDEKEKWIKLVQNEDCSDQFIYGDLWPSSILLNINEKRITIIDWECARMGNSFEDTTQLMANLYLMTKGVNFNNQLSTILLEKIAKTLNSNGNERMQADFIYTTLTLVPIAHWGLQDQLQVANECELVAQKLL